MGQGRFSKAKFPSTGKSSTGGGLVTSVAGRVGDVDLFPVDVKLPSLSTNIDGVTTEVAHDITVQGNAVAQTVKADAGLSSIAEMIWDRLFAYKHNLIDDNLSRSLTYSLELINGLLGPLIGLGRNPIYYPADIVGIQMKEANGGTRPFGYVRISAFSHFWDGVTLPADVQNDLAVNGNIFLEKDLSVGVLGTNSAGKIVPSTSQSLGNAQYIQFASTPSGVPISAGVISWNSSANTLDLQMPGGVVQQIGQEAYVQVKNVTGSPLANGSLVYVNGVSGSIPTVALAKADAVATSGTIGMLTQSIADGSTGMCTVLGIVHGLNTNGLTAGSPVFLSSSVAGGYTGTAPTSPNSRIHIGYAVDIGGSTGSILLHVEPTLVGLTELLEGVQAEGAFTGFADPANVGVAYDSTTRKITLTHSSGTVVYFFNGQKVSLASPWVSAAHTNADGTYSLYSSDGVNIVWNSGSFPSFNGLMVASVYKSASNIFAMRECHGQMDPDTHREFHSVIKTYFGSGGLLTAGSYATNSANDADTCPNVDAITIYDEDLPTSLTAFSKAVAGVRYVRARPLNSTSLQFDLDQAFPFTSAGSYIQWYNGTSLTTGINNRYYNVYAVAVPVASDAGSQAYKWIWFQPQAEHTTLVAAQAEDFYSLNLYDLAGYFAEFLPRVRLTYLTATGNANTGKCRLQTPSYLAGKSGGSVSFSGVFQPLDENLTSLSGLTLASDNLLLATGASTLSQQAVTTLSKALLTDATQAAMQSRIGAQASNTNLTALAGLTLAADRLLLATGAGALSQQTVTTLTKTLLADATTAALQATIDVIGALLTGLSTATNSAVVATDSILVGMGKLQAQINSPAAQKPVNLVFSSMTQVTATRGKLWKSVATGNLPTFDFNQVASGWDNRAHDPYVSNGGTIRSVSVNLASCSVSAGSKAATVYCRLALYAIKLNSAGGGTLLATFDVPVTQATVLVNNSGNVCSGVCSGTLSVNVATAAGDLLGLFFDNSGSGSSPAMSSDGWLSSTNGMVVSLNMY